MAGIPSRGTPAEIRSFGSTRGGGVGSGLGVEVAEAGGDPAGVELSVVALVGPVQAAATMARVRPRSAERGKGPSCPILRMGSARHSPGTIGPDATTTLAQALDHRP